MKLKGLMKMLTLTSVREREGDNEDGPLGASLKLEATMPIAKLKGVYSTALSYELLLAGLYDENGDLKTQDAPTIPLDIEAPKCKATVAPSVGSQLLTFDEAKISGIVIRPMQGRVAEITLKLYTRCDEEEFGRFGGMLKHSIEVTVSGRAFTTADMQNEKEDQQELKLPGAGADAGSEPESQPVH